jgi:hypothetical protein
VVVVTSEQCSSADLLAAIILASREVRDTSYPSLQLFLIHLKQQRVTSYCWVFGVALLATIAKGAPMGLL